MKKFLHIIDQISPIFTSQIIELVNGKLGLENNSKFVTFDKQLVTKMSYQNVELNENLINYINKNYKQYDYIFIHAMNFGIRQLIHLKKQAIKKFIWCVWGHDLYLKPRNSLDRMKFKLRRNILKKIYGVGIGFHMDLLEIRKSIGYEPRCFFLPYGYDKGTYKNYLQIYNSVNSNKKLNIMVGHNAAEELNHIAVLEKLKRFANNNINIILVLAYGPTDNAEKVAKYAVDNFGEHNVTIFRDLLGPIDYMKLLSTVDVAIFDNPRQIALGNIWKLAFLGKKIFLNDDSIIKNALDLLGLKTHYVSEIDKMTFQEFSSQLSLNDIDRLHSYGDTFVNEHNIEQAWRTAFNQLGGYDE